jgi:hypothetical protein
VPLDPVLDPEAVPLDPAVLAPEPVPLDPAVLEPDATPREPEAPAPEPEVTPMDPEAAPLETDASPLTPEAAPLEPEVSPLAAAALVPDDMSFADPSSDSTERLEPPHAASERASTHPLPTPTGLFTATVLSAPSRARIRASAPSIAPFGPWGLGAYCSSAIDQVIPGPAQIDLAIMASAAL